MEWKADIMDQQQLYRSMARIAHEIIEKNNGAEHICLLGIKTRGIYLANILRDNIEKFDGIKVPVGEVDITYYRDDRNELSSQPETSGSLIPVEPEDYTMILVDDVISTGRTVRAAIDAVMKHGRPSRIQLAVLIDRGHRELPIRPDFVGKNIPTSKNEHVSVKIDACDGETGVSLYAL